MIKLKSLVEVLTPAKALARKHGVATVPGHQVGNELHSENPLDDIMSDIGFILKGDSPSDDKIKKIAEYVRWYEQNKNRLQ